ncbi:hypothetical protein [Microbacterium gorillae]|uniref:hypothetical protein n=1 Tax=Microbacterium gorillae TaxID=1231063 RepID=UPI003D973A95
MYILLAVIGGILLGAAAHAMLPARASRGVVVSGALGGAAAAIVYTALTWSGVAESSVWMWVASLGAAIVVAVLGTVILTRQRLSHDAAEDARLGIA